jgi:hypothetical protein
LNKVKSNSAETVQNTTSVAFKILQKAPSNSTTSSNDNEESEPSLESLKQALEVLDKGLKSHSLAKEVFKADMVPGLAGVGPATSMIILSLFDSSIPYYSDEAYLESVGPAKLAYNVKECLRLTETLRAKAKDLGWRDANSVGVTLWTWSMAKKLGLGDLLKEGNDAEKAYDDGDGREDVSDTFSDSRKLMDKRKRGKGLKDEDGEEDYGKSANNGSREKRLKAVK